MLERSGSSLALTNNGNDRWNCCVHPQLYCFFGPLSLCKCYICFQRAILLLWRPTTTYNDGFNDAFNADEMRIAIMNLHGKRVLVMGLGLQGSGMAAARYAAQQGASVRVTDMKSPD